MKKVFIIAKKEIGEHLNSGQVFVLSIAFLAMVNSYFAENVFSINKATLYHVFKILPYVNMVFIPALTMSSFASEFNLGTMELLVTLPFTRMEIILGKVLGNLSIYFSLLLSTLTYFISIWAIGNPDMGQIFAGYLAALLLGLTLTIIGLFASSLSKSSITGFVVAFIISLFLIYLDQLSHLTRGSLSLLLQNLSIDYHYSNILKGVIDLRNISYFLSLNLFFGYLLKISFEVRD